MLLYHVVSGVISSDMADNDIKLDSVQGSPLLVNLYLKSKFYDVRTEHSKRLLIRSIYHPVIFIGLHHRQRQACRES